MVLLVERTVSFLSMKVVYLGEVSFLGNFIMSFALFERTPIIMTASLLICKTGATRDLHIFLFFVLICYPVYSYLWYVCFVINL